MANIVRLGKGASRKIQNAIDDLYDNVKVRLLGPNAAGKRIFITFDRNFSIPGIFEAGSIEESIKPDMEVLASLIRVAQDYLDASRERMKAKVVHSINGALAEAKHTGGMSREQFRGLVNTKLSEVWADATNSVHTIIDTEINHTKNVSILDGIVGANLNAGIDDPTVYFVVVRDEDLCDECKRLHLLSDGKTPRLWKLSELSHGYHKKGEDHPSIGGLHPHCRCSIVTLMPGYGFTKEGFVSYKKMGHDALEEQRRLERSMPEFGGVLAKAEGKARFDPNQHPRDPKTGEFINHDAAYMDSISKGTKRVQREWEAMSPEEKRLAIEHARKVFRAFYKHYPELYQDLLRRPYMASEVALDENGEPVDNSEDDVGSQDPEDLGKASNYPGAIFAEPTSESGKRLQQQIRSEADNPLTSHLLDSPLLHTYNNLLFGYKYHSNGRKGQLLKYLAHRHQNLEDYDDPDDAAALDEEFDIRNNRLRALRAGIRGTQARTDSRKKVRETTYPAHQLKHDLGHNIHLYDQMLQHQESLHQRLLNSGLLYMGGHPGTENGPYVVVARSFREPQPTKHHMLASFADTIKDARTDPMLGQPGKHRFFYALPLSALLASYHHAGKYSFAHPYRTSENELLALPHKEIILPEEHGMQHIKELVPPPKGIGTSGRKAMASIPKKQRKPPRAGVDDMNRPFIIPPTNTEVAQFARSEKEDNDPS